MAIEFYKEFGELGYLANYAPYGFYKDGVYYKTVEHYYQSEKFNDEKIRTKIINCETPKEASMIGRDRNNKRKDNFKSMKQAVMLTGVLEKFRQNKEILYKLIETRNEPIVEKTIDEYYWGIGKDNSGQNNFGKILCQARVLLKQEILNKIITNSKDEVYILGHNHPDADSLFSSYLLSNILNSMSIKTHFCILSCDYEYSQNDIKLINDHFTIKPEVIDNLENKKFILVDHNTLDGLDKNNVVGAIDHHIISYQVDNTLEIEYASTALLIYDLFKDVYLFTPKEKLLIGLTVLADTEYLCSSRYSLEDQKLFESLKLNINIKDYQKRYFVTTDFTKNITDNINSNMKQYDYEEKLINRVLISSYTIEFNNYFEKYIAEIKKIAGYWLLIWADYDKKNTTIYYNNNIYELNYLTTSTYVVFKELKNKCMADNYQLKKQI